MIQNVREGVVSRLQEDAVRKSIGVLFLLLVSSLALLVWAGESAPADGHECNLNICPQRPGFVCDSTEGTPFVNDQWRKVQMPNCRGELVRCNLRPGIEVCLRPEEADGDVVIFCGNDCLSAVPPFPRSVQPVAPAAPPTASDPHCGDGVVNLERGETCDPPGSIPAGLNRCRADCTYCGDGVLQSVEQCDEASDGCNQWCDLRIVPRLDPPYERGLRGGLIGVGSLIRFSEADQSVDWLEQLVRKSDPGDDDEGRDEDEDEDDDRPEPPPPPPPLDPRLQVDIGPLYGLTGGIGYEWLYSGWAVAGELMLLDTPDVDVSWEEGLEPHFTSFGPAEATRVSGGRWGVMATGFAPLPRAKRWFIPFSVFWIDDQDTEVCWLEGSAQPCVEIHRDAMPGVGLGVGRFMGDRFGLFAQLLLGDLDYDVSWKERPDPSVIRSSDVELRGDGSVIGLRIGARF